MIAARLSLRIARSGRAPPSIALLRSCDALLEEVARGSDVGRALRAGRAGDRQRECTTRASPRWRSGTAAHGLYRSPPPSSAPPWRPLQRMSSAPVQTAAPYSCSLPRGQAGRASQVPAPGWAGSACRRRSAVPRRPGRRRVSAFEPDHPTHPVRPSGAERSRGSVRGRDARPRVGRAGCRVRPRPARVVRRRARPTPRKPTAVHTPKAS